MKIKTIIKPKNEFIKWIGIANLFAKSMISPNDALKQYFVPLKK